MGRVNSKSKGNGFEAKISKLLSEKLSPMQFRRSQSSGAILGGQNDKFLDQFSIEAKTLFVGDVVPSNEEDVYRTEGWKFRFTLECKFYKTVETLEQLHNNSKLWDWYSKAETDAAKVNKQPLVIFKFNHTDIYCATQPMELPSSVRSIITLHNGVDTLLTFKLDSAFQDLSWFKIYTDKNVEISESAI